MTKWLNRRAFDSTESVWLFSSHKSDVKILIYSLLSVPVKSVKKLFAILNLINRCCSLEMENEVKVDIGPPPGEMVVESEIESFEDLGPGTGIDNFSDF